MTTDHSATSAPENTDYQRTIGVKASPGALFDALTSLEGLSAWWVPVTGSADAGGELRFRMSSSDPLVVHVDEATRPTLVRWTVTACNFMSDWVGTRPTFAITPLDGGDSQLRFRHYGLTSDLDCIDICTRSWNHFIVQSLRGYVESGHGHPLGSPADKAWRAEMAATRW